MPGQERGVRPARALPYELQVHGTAHMIDGTFELQFVNTGRAAAVLQVRSGSGADLPRSYTVAPHTRLSDVWNITATGAFDYDLTAYGPNGFLRAFKGGVAGSLRANLDVRALYDARGNGITLTISNQAAQPASVSVLNKYTGARTARVLEPGESFSKRWSLSRVFGWYDVVMTVDEDPGFAYQFAGHVETGEDSISDPAMGGLAADSTSDAR
jgi:phospholipase C